MPKIQGIYEIWMQSLRKRKADAQCTSVPNMNGISQTYHNHSQHNTTNQYGLCLTLTCYISSQTIRQHICCISAVFQHAKLELYRTKLSNDLVKNTRLVYGMSQVHWNSFHYVTPWNRPYEKNKIKIVSFYWKLYNLIKNSNFSCPNNHGKDKFH